MSMVRIVLTEKKIPKRFWPEAVNWSMYILNRSPNVTVENKTPKETWSGFRLAVEHFRVFDCIGRVHIPTDKKTKLDDKSHKRVFLGMSEESKGYMLYNPVAQRIIVSRDVRFEANAHQNQEESHKEELQLDLKWGETNSSSDCVESEASTSNIEEGSNDIGNVETSSATSTASNTSSISAR